MRLDAYGGGDPDDGNEGDEAKRNVRVLAGNRDRDEIDEERKVVFALNCRVLRLQLARVAETATDGQTQEEKAEPCHDHGRDVDGNREGVHLLVEDIGGEEGEQREAEEETEVGVEDTLVGLLGAVDEVVMVDPVNGSEGKGDEVEAQGGQDSAEAGEAILMGDLQFEHHNGDDDGDDSVGEGFEAGCFEDAMRHGRRSVFVFGRSIQRRLWAVGRGLN